MTQEELSKIPFHFVGSLALENEHCLTYSSEDGRLGFCEHTKRRKNGDFGRTYRHYRIDGKIYRTKEKFLEALADFSPNIIPISGKYNKTLKIQKE